MPLHSTETPAGERGGAGLNICSELTAGIGGVTACDKFFPVVHIITVAVDHSRTRFTRIHNAVTIDIFGQVWNPVAVGVEGGQVEAIQFVAFDVAVAIACRDLSWTV